jgi:uncharacterized protein YggT (Ycf19 family)
MDLIHHILNLAGLLLWLNWRTAGFAAQRTSSPLLTTLKRTDARRQRWWQLLALVGLLGARALFYWQIGSAVEWIPGLDLRVITLRFRSDFFDRMFLFSILSFGWLLAIFYAALLLLSALNGRGAETNPWQVLLRLHLGSLNPLPGWLKVFLPVAFTAVAWFATAPLLSRMNLIPPAGHDLKLVQQALLLALGFVLVWEYALIVLLGLHLLNSYVYLGNRPFWGFVHHLGRQTLLPLRGLPLRLHKLDLAPLLALVIVAAAGHGASLGLTQLYRLASL